MQAKSAVRDIIAYLFIHYYCRKKALGHHGLFRSLFKMAHLLPD